MRKVRNPSLNTNPSVLFARGVESLVTEHTNRPRFAESDRKHEREARRQRIEPRGNLFALLMRQFASN